MSTNPLNDISRVYLEQVIESAVPGKPAERLGAVTAIPKAEQDAARERTLAKAKAMREKKGITKEALDPVGQEDADVDNDGKKNTKSDKYLLKRREAISKAISTQKEEVEKLDEISQKTAISAYASRATGEYEYDTNPSDQTKSGKYKSDVARERIKKKFGDKAAQHADRAAHSMTFGRKGMPSVKEALDPVGKEDEDIDNDGDVDKSDAYLKHRRKVRGKVIAKEGYSNWREDLIEVVDKISKDKSEDVKITEKQVNNKIQINPKLDLGEAVENLGGTLLEMVEIDEFDFIVESVYDELLDEGFGEDDIEEALEYALTEAKVTFGHDTATEKKRSGLMAAAKQKLASAKKVAKQAVATGARKVAKGALGVARKMESGDTKPSAAHTKTRTASTYRGAGAGQKERVSSGSYEPAKATAAPKAKTKKAAAPKTKTTTTRKKSKLDDLLADIRSEEAKPFPFKKVEAQKEKARKGSVYGKDTGNSPVPQVSDAEKKATTRFSKMQHTYEKEKRAKQEADKARRSSTFYKDTHPASAPKMKKANEEFQLDEKTLTAAETKEKERLVKSMKDKAADFEKRYPGRGKEVMYATATKMAKKMAEQAMELQPKSQQSGQQDQAQKKIAQQKDRQRQQEVQILQRKLQALRSAPRGIDTDITA